VRICRASLSFPKIIFGLAIQTFFTMPGLKMPSQVKLMTEKQIPAGAFIRQSLRVHLIFAFDIALKSRRSKPPKSN
jgi:hypothetical protein